MKPALEVQNLTLGFGGIKALNDVSFSVPRGTITGLIGPNGAGKTSLFNCISGLYRPDDGMIKVLGKKISNLRPDQVADHGIARTFQNVALFDTLTVADNIKIGAYRWTATTWMGDCRHSRKSRNQERKIEAGLEEVAPLIGIEDLLNYYPSSLPLGSQKRIELARALLMKPKLLLLDEPAGGINHTEVRQLGDLIKKIQEYMDLTVLLVEHHMGLVRDLVQQLVVLNFGTVLADGSASDVLRDPTVIKAYLGR